MEERKPGIYLCEGCGIADAISMDDLETLATGELKTAHCKRHAAFCSDEGVAIIEKDVSSGAVNQPVIAACSHRVMADKFTFDGAQTVRANLREQVAWTQPAQEEDTQMLASDNLRMAVAQAKKIDPPEPHGEGVVSTTLLVVGGGITGLNAALEAAKTGVDVILVEKSDALGGWATKWSRSVPSRPPYRDPQPNPVHELIAAVEANDKITVMHNTIVARTSGGPGAFYVTLDQAGNQSTEIIGAIVVATGWRPLDPASLENLGYGSSPDIISDIECEALLNDGARRKSDGTQPQNVVFIISGDPQRMPYSSGISERVVIKQALQLIEMIPGVMINVIYEDFRAHGTTEEFYRQAQEAGVIFQKGTVKSVSSDLTVTVDDALLGEEIPMGGLDLVVLSTGMIPNSTNVDLDPSDRGIALLKDDINPRVPITIGGQLVDGDDITRQPATPYEEGEEPALPGGPILNLQYRQGPHLPILANGFADSHYICFPYETRRTGIYTCGPVRRPMTMAEAAEDAQGAVLKAIQSMNAADNARAMHPRVGDLSFPEFGLNICTKCRRCTVECPFGAIDELANGYPQLNPSRCRRCGTCMGACPVRTISFKNYNVAMVSDMIKAVEVPDEFAEKPRMLVLACENDAYPALDMAGINRSKVTPYIRTIPVRCLGSVTNLWVSTAIESGYDGVMLMGCKSGDDYQCHFVKGSGIAKERMGKVGETLKSMMLEEERVTMEEVSIADSVRVVDVVNGFSKIIEELDPSPMKGF